MGKAAEHQAAEEAGDVRVSVVITARNAARTLGATLAGLAGQDLRERFEVIVVDNGSGDDTASIAEQAPLGVKVIRRPPGDGPGVARNEGAAAAAGEWLAFTDADCVPSPGWLREGLAALGAADLVQGAVAPDPAATFMPFDHTVWVERPTGLFETANLFVAREWFERVGGFQDILETGGGRPFGEDAWLGWRLVRAGAREGFAERAIVHHEVLRRGPGAFIAERLRLSLFPALASRLPELRGRIFFHRYFFSARSFAFDLALIGLVAALASGLAIIALVALPYLYLLIMGVVGWRRWAPAVLIAQIAADAVSFLALGWGSIRSRTLLI